MSDGDPSPTLEPGPRHKSIPLRPLDGRKGRCPLYEWSQVLLPRPVSWHVEDVYKGTGTSLPSWTEREHQDPCKLKIRTELVHDRPGTCSRERRHWLATEHGPLERSVNWHPTKRTNISRNFTLFPETTRLISSFVSGCVEPPSSPSELI